MDITREMLEARLAKLRAEILLIQADYNAHEGAIQDCEHWLEILEQVKDAS